MKTVSHNSLAQFEKRLKQQLLHVVNDIDAATANDLARARRLALARVSTEKLPTPWWQLFRQPLLAGSMASIMLAVVAVLMWGNGDSIRGDTWQKDMIATDIDMLVHSEEDQAVVEDLEFFAWLAETQWQG